MLVSGRADAADSVLPLTLAADKFVNRRCLTTRPDPEISSASSDRDAEDDAPTGTTMSLGFELTAAAAPTPAPASTTDIQQVVKQMS
jgi:hypothetical protein